jgi:hypothetical protein
MPERRRPRNGPSTLARVLRWSGIQTSLAKCSRLDGHPSKNSNLTGKPEITAL